MTERSTHESLSALAEILTYFVHHGVIDISQGVGSNPTSIWALFFYFYFSEERPYISVVPQGGATLLMFL